MKLLRKLCLSATRLLKYRIEKIFFRSEDTTLYKFLQLFQIFAFCNVVKKGNHGSYCLLSIIFLLLLLGATSIPNEFEVFSISIWPVGKKSPHINFFFSLFMYLAIFVHEVFIVTITRRYSLSKS